MRRWPVFRLLAGLAARLALGVLVGSAVAALGQSVATPAELYRRAQQAMQAGDYGTAAEAWKALVALAPEVPEVRSNLGLAYHLKRDYELAIEEFRAALRQNPKLLAAKVFLGVDYYLTSRPELAIRELEGARAIDSSSALARKWLAMSYVQTERYASAITELQACRRLDPQDHELVFHLGRVYRELSTRAFLAVRRAGLQSPWLFLLRGLKFVRQGDTRNALDELRHAARLAPRMPGVHREIGAVLEDDGRLLEAVRSHALELSNFPANLESAAGLVRTLAKLGLHDKANAVRERAIAFHDGAPEAARALPWADPGRGPDSSLAPGEAVRIVGLLPAFGIPGERSWTSRARDAILAGQPDLVVELAKNFESDASQDEALYWRARAYLAMGRADRAVEDLMRLHSRQPKNVEFAFYLQACAEELALEYLDLFASSEPGSYRTHQLRAEYHASAEDIDEATAEYAKALAKAPGAAQLHLAVGLLHLGQRDYDKALAAFRSELENDPYSVEALSRMGEVYFVLGASAQANEALKRAIAINPRSAGAHKTLGRVYFKEREYQKSVEHLQAALRLGIRQDEELHYHLGRAQRMLGNSVEAEKNLAIVSRLKEARQAIAQQRLESSIAKPSAESGRNVEAEPR